MTETISRRNIFGNIKNPEFQINLGDSHLWMRAKCLAQRKNKFCSSEILNLTTTGDISLKVFSNIDCLQLVVCILNLLTRAHYTSRLAVYY